MGLLCCVSLSLDNIKVDIKSIKEHKSFRASFSLKKNTTYLVTPCMNIYDEIKQARIEMNPSL